MEIEGKVAIVTGAGSGIGRATAVALAKCGARGVVLADVDRQGLAATSQQVRDAGADALTTITEVTVVASLEEMYRLATEHFGVVDIVFNNAGIVSGPPPFPDTPIERTKLVVDIDLTSVIVSTQIALRFMRGRGGVIINTASTGGLNPFLSDAPYAAAKAGVIMFSRACAGLRELMNVRVNAVCPGITETPILEKLGAGVRPDWLEPLTAGIQLLQPSDIAKAVIGIIRNDNLAGEHVVVANRPAGA